MNAALIIAMLVTLFISTGIILGSCSKKIDPYLIWEILFPLVIQQANIARLNLKINFIF